jgi:hypothetical protein
MRRRASQLVPATVTDELLDGEVVREPLAHRLCLFGSRDLPLKRRAMKQRTGGRAHNTTKINNSAAIARISMALCMAAPNKTGTESTTAKIHSEIQ